MFYSNVLQCIGNTPIVRLNRVAEDSKANFFAKLEFMNPGGSVKDRIGYYLIEDAERRGLLKPGGTIVEATSGNTGMGLAIAAAVKGYQCVFVLPEKMAIEKIRTLQSFGAQVVVTPLGLEADDPRSHYSVARRIAETTPNAYLTSQYDNLANTEVHYLKTGPEIWNQLPEIDALVAGMGTGGTLCGSGKYLKEMKPSVKLICTDPIGSITGDMYRHGKVVTPPAPYLNEGIGEDFVPKNFNFAILDDVFLIDDRSSFTMTRRLLHEEGLYCGMSGGGAVHGAIEWTKTLGERARGMNVLVILADSGDRYMSKVWNDDWMRKQGFLEGNAGFKPVQKIEGVKRTDI